MPRNHRTWQVVLAYCKEIPIHNNIVKTIRSYLKENKNVLIMINRENPATNPKFTPEKKFKALKEILKLSKSRFNSKYSSVFIFLLNKFIIFAVIKRNIFSLNFFCFFLKKIYFIPTIHKLFL